MDYIVNWNPDEFVSGVFWPFTVAGTPHTGDAGLPQLPKEGQLWPR